METSGSMTCWVMSGVFLSLRICEFVCLNPKFHSLSTTRLGGRSKTRCRCSPLSVSRCFMMFPVPTPFPNVATAIRTRHCRLRRSCVDDSSGSVGFKTAIVVHSCSVSRGTGGYAKCETRVFGTHVIICCRTLPKASPLVDLPVITLL